MKNLIKLDDIKTDNYEIKNGIITIKGSFTADIEKLKEMAKEWENVEIKCKYKCLKCGRIKTFIFDKRNTQTGGLWISKTNTPCLPVMECSRCKILSMKRIGVD